jgi:flagellar protein FlbD
MIDLHRLNGDEFFLNADLIESIESTPDTVITLNSGKKIMVKDRLEDVVKKILRYKQLSHQVIRVVSQPDSAPAEKPKPGSDPAAGRGQK